MYEREALRTAQYDVTASRLDAITDSVHNADSLPYSESGIVVSTSVTGCSERWRNRGMNRVRNELIMLLSGGYEQDVLEQRISASATTRPSGLQKTPLRQFASSKWQPNG